MKPATWMWLAKGALFGVGVALHVTGHLPPDLAILLAGALGAMGVRGAGADMAAANAAADRVMTDVKGLH